MVTPPRHGLLSKAVTSIILTLWLGLVVFDWAGHYVMLHGFPRFTAAAADAEPAPAKDAQTLPSAEAPALPIGPPAPIPQIGPPAPIPQIGPPAPIAPVGPPVLAQSSEDSDPVSSDPVETLEPEEAASEPVESSTEPDASEPEPESPAPAAPAADPPAPRPPSAPAPAPAPVAGSHQQYGAFANPDNARRLAEELNQSGKEARIEEIETTQGKLYRVRGDAAQEAAPPAEPAAEKAPPASDTPNPGE
ncbi:MAG: SPOR domain-containing protein [Armatimonadetes bacterium]|nr:SPOR domain-containing protein [Armatimonadota bacterium]